MNLFCFKGGDVLHNQVLNRDVHVDDVLTKEDCDGNFTQCGKVGKVSQKSVPIKRSQKLSPTKVCQKFLTQCGECQSGELQKGPKAEFQGLGCLITITNIDDDDDEEEDCMRIIVMTI